MKILLLSCLLLMAPFFLRAQITLEAVPLDTMLIDFFDGGCVELSNINSVTPEGSTSFFQYVGSELPIQAGILLTTGTSIDVANPASTFVSSSLSGSGNPLLDSLLFQGTNNTTDVTFIEFDFTSCLTDLAFWYTFGSEEYPEFVNSLFNDAFAFFVSGPGIDGYKNVAVLPDSANTIVSINSVNQDLNNSFFIDNMGGTDCAYDGLTTLMPAAFTVQTGQTYHAFIAVADVSDSDFDSGVFLGVQSIGGDSLLMPPANFLMAQDNGNDNTIEFSNQSRYALTHTWDFGNGTGSSERNPSPVTYFENGIYNVSLITTNYCCSDTFTQTVNIGSVGTKELRNNGFNIQPNPIVNVAVLDLPEGKLGTLTLTNAMGQLLLTQTCSGKTEFLAGHLPQGTYILRFETNHQVLTQQFIKY